MDSKHLTPKGDNSKYKNKDENIIIDNTKSVIFKDKPCSCDYLEIISNDGKFIKIIFRNPAELYSKNSEFAEIIEEKLNQFNEITLIFDYQRLSYELETKEMKTIIEKFRKKIVNNDFTKLSVIIKNSYYNPKKELIPIEYNNKLILNKLEIVDELFSLTTKLNILFPNLQVNELILKKMKFNSKSQLSNFCKFIRKVECKKVTLEDIFIELILKKDENDEGYKDLDIYFSFVDGVITLENIYTSITSLTLRDCPLFAIEGDIFNDQNEYRNKDIDIDENSLINPFIVTKFKIKNRKYEICFDLDSFKIKLEENGVNNKYDYIDYLDYIFYIVISFKRDGQKIIEDKKNWEDIDDGLGDINRKKLYKLIFKNFDITKLEYIYDDNLTYIKEENWVLNEEQKKKKRKWEKLEKDLQNFDFEKLSEVKELVFDNCSNFFVKWILQFIKGKKYENKNQFDDLNLLKIKKCGKDYIDLNNILTMKITNVILFDSPLIIPKNDEGGNLDDIDGDLGSIGNLTIKINSLDCYGKQYNLNTYKTLEILVELIKKDKFNRNLTFELSSLSSILTYLANQVYLKNQDFYKDPNEEERGDDAVFLDDPKGVNNEADIIKGNPTYLPRHIFFSSKKKRDFIYTKAFNLDCLKGSMITLKNLTIKKLTENFDNQNYLLIKKNKSAKSYTDNYDLRKIDFGSDGFFINRDYKNFFSENNIGTVELINVIFSNFKDNNSKEFEEEAIINLISNNENEEESIEQNKYKKTYFPNYRIDVKTLNGILYRNFFFEDIGIMFKYFMYIIEPQNQNGKRNMISNDSYEKKKALSEYFKKFNEIFDCFKNNIKKLTIIINNVKELKEFYCTLCVLRVLIKDDWIMEKVCVQGSKKNFDILLPNKKCIEKEIGNYFIKDKNEEEVDCYSEMDYYYSSFEEKKMVKDKEINIQGYQFYLDLKFEDEYYQEV